MSSPSFSHGPFITMGAMDSSQVPTVFFLGVISSMQFIQRWVDGLQRLFMAEKGRGRGSGAGFLEQNSVFFSSPFCLGVRGWFLWINTWEVFFFCVCVWEGRADVFLGPQMDILRSCWTGWTLLSISRVRCGGFVLGAVSLLQLGALKFEECLSF